jgi:hypothetical protein
MLPPLAAAPPVLLGGLVLHALSGVLRLLLRVLMAPLWFFDKWDKESIVLSIPPAVRRRLLKIMFGPTLGWTMLLHRAMPDTRRWYDRVDERVRLRAICRRRCCPWELRVSRVLGPELVSPEQMLRPLARSLAHRPSGGLR